jgi:hypothetical protein
MAYCSVSALRQYPVVADPHEWPSRTCIRRDCFLANQATFVRIVMMFR